MFFLVEPLKYQIGKWFVLPSLILKGYTPNRMIKCMVFKEISVLTDSMSEWMPPVVQAKWWTSYVHFSWQSKCLAYFVSPGSVGGIGGGVKNRRFCSQRIRAEIVHLVQRLLKSQAQHWRGFESPVRQGISFQESTFSADSLTASVQPPRVQSCASTSVRTLKIPNTDSHSIVWKVHQNTTPSGRNG